MDQHSEEETEIVQRLQRFQPRPSPKAYQRMAHTPWNNPIERKSMMQTILPSRRFRTSVAVVMIVVLAGVVVMATPSLRVLAQELLNTLFNRESNSTITVQPPALPTTGDAGTLTDVTTVETEAGFHIAQPQSIPAGYAFSGVGYTESRHAVSLVYERPGAELSITQQPVEYAEFGLLTDGASGIGPDAPIASVQIGDVVGEYVAGTWIMTSENQAVWQANAPSQRLRWQEGGMIYEILANGGSSDTGSGFDQSGLIAIALSLQ